MRLNLTIGTRLFLSHLLAILLVSGSIGTYFYLRASRDLMESLRGRLLSGASLVAEMVDARELDAIRGPEAIGTPEYERLLERLRTLRRSNPDLAFLYIMRDAGGHAEFVVDSDNTDRQAKPGDDYDETLPAMLEGFERPAADESIATDEWGSFLSGYAPIRKGHDRYLLGMDMRAQDVRNWFSNLRASGALSLLLSAALAFLFSGIGTRYYQNYLRLFVVRCREIADGRFLDHAGIRTGSDLDALSTAMDQMADGLLKSTTAQRQAETALREANEELEQRVAERTIELTQKNQHLADLLSDVKRLSGLLPICASCKKIRDDKGYWLRVEEYMQSHSEARFSHSVCPDCMKQLYGERL